MSEDIHDVRDVNVLENINALVLNHSLLSLLLRVLLDKFAHFEFLAIRWSYLPASSTF